MEEIYQIEMVFLLVIRNHKRHITGVKQCTFHWLISIDIAQKGMVLNSLIIHHLIMITCISYEIIFAMSLPKLIDIALIKTFVICVTDSNRL